MPLGSRAADLLIVLAQERGRVVSREELVARAWSGRTVAENNLAVQIGALRRALGNAPDGSSWIRTVSGRGYSLVSEGTERRPDTALVLPPQRVSFCTTADGATLAVALSGEGSPLVRVGLWMTHVELERSTRVWGPFIKRLSEGNTLVRYDQRGCGLSTREVERFSLDQSVADLSAVLDHLGLDRASILGMSQGVPVAVRFAARYPNRVDKLILHGGFAKGWGVETAPERIAHMEALITLISQGWGRDNPTFRQIFTSLGFPEGSREDFDAYNELQRHSVDAANAARIVEALRNVDVRPDLRHIRAETLVSHSLRDAWVAIEASRALAAGIPGARFLALDSSNHLPIPPDAEFERLISAISETAATAPRS